MKKVALAFVAAILAAVSARAEEPIRIGEPISQRYETPHPYTSTVVSKDGVAWTDVITYPGASYIAPHFSRFHLAEGDTVIVRSPDAARSWKYQGLGNAELGESRDGFWGVPIPGDTAVVELLVSKSGGEFGYAIDRIARGYRPEEMASPEAICGTDDSDWAKCYQFTEPRIYDRARAVARLTIQGMFLCTGWLIGNAGHLMTNSHCITNTADAQNTTYEFMAEGATCTTNCPQLACTGTYVSTTATLVQRSADAQDFTLVRLPTNPTCTYGYVPLRSTAALGNERIYIPNHSAGKGKRIAVFSTDPSDESGYCEVTATGQSINCAGYPGIDVTYKADTEGGSSGSPVVAYSDHKAIALHHCSLGSPCGSSGGQITNIITLLGANLPPGALIDRVGSVRFDRHLYGCSDVMTIDVQDDTQAGAGTESVSVVSSTEPAGETVTLNESPGGSGHFVRTFPTTSSPAVSGDGALSVHGGDTITVSYVDVDGGPGCGSATRTDSATADCTPPVISNVAVSNVQGGFADVSWNTNEPSDSVVTYGRADSPPPTLVASSGALVSSHGVRVFGLDSCTPYVFKVRSTDPYNNSAVADNGGANYGFTTQYEVSRTYPYPGPPVAIPDNDVAGAVATLQVPDPGTILDLKVKVNVTHPRDGDLLMYLQGPDATQITLIALRGGNGGNFVNTVLDDQASLSISQGSAPFTGSFRPEQALSAFSGKVAQGTWTLRVADTSAGSTGSISGFEIKITFPSRTCYFECTRDTQSLIQDTCSAGGSGNGDGTWDDGEEARIGVTLRNSGTLPLTGITATLTPTTPGVAMADDTASYPDLSPGVSALSQSPHFRATLPVGFTCGAPIDFRVDIITGQGNFSDTVRLYAGRIVTPTVVPLSESFSGGIPGSWTVVDGGTDGGVAATWTTANPGGRTFTPPIADPVAIVDSDVAGGGATQDEELITPVLNLSTALSVTLEFDQSFSWYNGDGDEKGDIDVRSSLTGGAWVNLLRNQGASSPDPDHRTIDITSQAAGAADVQVRFHYYDGAWENFWEVDNVKVSYVAPSYCAMTSCNVVPPPGEVFSLTWSSKTGAQWSSVPGAASYNLYTGTRANLPAVLTPSVDSCLRGTTGGLSMSGLSEVPSAGSFSWWLVRAQNTAGQGTAGNAHVNHAPAARSQDSSGACP